MWMEKIRHGVLEVQSEAGLRYVRPSLGERIRLLWTFRNFQLLPQQVLNQRELALVAGLLENGKFQAAGDCRIGIIEWLASPLPSRPAQLSARQPVRSAPTAKSSPAAATPVTNTRERRKARRGEKGTQGPATLLSLDRVAVGHVHHPAR
jgi:hypothetical protein